MIKLYSIFDAKELLVRRHRFHLLRWSKRMWTKAIIDIMVREALGRRKL